MSSRLHPRLGLAALALAALAACNDSSTQPQQPALSPLPANLTLSPSCKVTEIYQLVTWLTPLRNAPLDIRGAVTVTLTFTATKQALAQLLVFKLAEAITPAVIAKLNTPPVVTGLTKEEAVAKLIGDIMQCAGIEPTQAPPTEAYLPSGGLKVIDQTGGRFTTNNKQAGARATAGAVKSPHLFYIVKLSAPIVSAPSGLAAASTPKCLPIMEAQPVIEVGDCYNFSVVPDVGAYDAELQTGFGGDGVYAGICSPGVDGQEVHKYLELAKVDHDNANSFTIYQRATDVLTGALACVGGDGTDPPTSSIMGAAWVKMVGAAKVLVSPFAPSVAYASDGVGSFLRDMTNATLVYRTRPLTVTPSSATVNVGTSQGFSATRTDGKSLRDAPYVWSVNGIDGGSDAVGTVTPGETGLSATSATYQAPASVPAGGTVTICVHRTAVVSGVVTALADRGCAGLTVQGNFVGNWSGTIFYQDLTPQPVTLNVTSQTASSASGELFIATADDPTPYNTTSHFTGVVDGNNLSFTMTQFTPNGGAVVNLTKSGDGLSGTMAELFQGELGRVFTANLSRSVIITMRATATRPSLSVSASPNASASTSASGPAFGTRAP